MLQGKLVKKVSYLLVLHHTIANITHGFRLGQILTSGPGLISSTTHRYYRSVGSVIANVLWCQYYHDSSNHIALYFTCHKRLVQIVNPKGIVTDEAMLVQRVLIL